MVKHFEIPTKNGNFIHANFFEAEMPKQLLIICSTTGVKQEFYHDISVYFQKMGITVSTFDYSGIGRSLKTSIKKVNSSMSDWATNDLTAVINYNAKIYPDLPITLLGHSIGGQLIGLTNASLIANKIILVSAQNGFWGYLNGIQKIKMWSKWNIIFPILVNTIGYLPSWLFSNLENLPKNVSKEWKNWSNNKNYLFAFIDKEHLSFSKIKCEIVSYNVAFDKYASEKSIDKLTERYTNAKIKRVQLYPQDLNVEKHSHFELFHKKSKFRFWNSVRLEVSNQKISFQ